MKNELELFIDTWEREATKTMELLEALPLDGYDFRPDPEGRSLGDLPGIWPKWRRTEPSPLSAEASQET